MIVVYGNLKLCTSAIEKSSIKY